MDLLANILPPNLPPEWLQAMLKAGCQVGMQTDAEGTIYYDLNLQSKSHLYLYHIDGEWVAKMRYDKAHAIRDFNDLLAAAVSGIHGRNFIHHGWAKLLTDNGYDLSKLMHSD